MFNRIVWLNTFPVLLMHTHGSMAMEQITPQLRPYGCRILEQPRRSPPPPAWYDVIGVSPVDELLGAEKCYAVIRVERGFEYGHVGGRYVIVTVLFREPSIAVVSKTLSLAEVQDEQAGAVYGLWRGLQATDENHRIKGIIGKVLKTEEQIFYYEDNGPVSHLAGNLNYWGIGVLPTTEIADKDSPLPLISFHKSVDAAGNVVWFPGMARGGRYDGGVTPWRFTVAVARGASVRRWEPTNEVGFSHEFTVEHPLSINDVRYENLLLTIARVSPVLASVLDERYAHLEARRKELAKRMATVGDNKEDERGSADEEVKPSPAAPEPGIVLDADREAGWPTSVVAAVAGIAGIVFGAGFVLILVGKRRR